MRKLFLVITFLLLCFTVQNAKADPISFTEDFSNMASLPGPFLEQSAGGTPATFDGGVATFPVSNPAWPPPGRSYLRTIDDDYNSVNFVAEITVTIFNGQFFDGGDGFGVLLVRAVIFLAAAIDTPGPVACILDRPPVTVLLKCLELGTRRHQRLI